MKPALLETVPKGFAHGKDAWVKLTLPESPTLTIPTDMVGPAEIAQTSAAATYLKLFGLALQQQEGLQLSQLTQKELSRRTGLSIGVIAHARQGLE